MVVSIIKRLYSEKDSTCEDVAGRLAFKFPAIAMVAAEPHLTGSRCLTISTDTNTHYHASAAKYRQGVWVGLYFSHINPQKKTTSL